jgi:hypothetical protein
MPEKLNSAIFLRIMRLPERERADLLEFLGQTQMSQPELELLISRFERKEITTLFKTG